MYRHLLLPTDGSELSVRAFTAGAAFAAFAEGQRGMIREGLDADLTAFEGDVFSIPVGTLSSLPVAATVVGGEVVFTR